MIDVRKEELYVLGIILGLVFLMFWWDCWVIDDYLDIKKCYYDLLDELCVFVYWFLGNWENVGSKDFC